MTNRIWNWLLVFIILVAIGPFVSFFIGYVVMQSADCAGTIHESLICDTGMVLAVSFVTILWTLPFSLAALILWGVARILYRRKSARRNQGSGI